MRHYLLILILLLQGTAWSAQTIPSELKPAIKDRIGKMYPEMELLYKELHKNPELSLQEEKTSRPR